MRRKKLMIIGCNICKVYLEIDLFFTIEFRCQSLKGEKIDDYRL